MSRRELVGNAQNRRAGASAVHEESVAGNGSYEAHQIRIQQLREREKESLQEAIRSSHDSVNVGHQSTAALNKQGESIQKIDGDLDKIEYELKVSDKLVKNMSSIGGMISSWFWKNPKAPKSKTSASASNESSQGPVPHVGEKLPITRNKIEPASTTEAAQHDAQTDLMFNELANNIAAMRENAATQRSILENQNKQLESLMTKVEKTDQHMKITTRNIKKV